MVALWGKKDDDAQTPPQNGESSDHIAEPRASEANERTHLLPPQNHDAYLSPDDPAVSFTCSHSAPSLQPVAAQSIAAI